MQHGRFITTAAAALAVMAIGPAGAMAAPGSVVDDGAADFGSGAAGTATSVVDPGSVQLKRAKVTEAFAGPDLPTGWSAIQWTTPDGTRTVGGGALAVDGERANTDRFFGPGQVLEFTATFSGAQFQSVGFGNDLATEPWAIVSTDGAGQLMARTFATSTDGQTTDVTPSANPLGPHTFRIEWSATEVKYYVDNAATPAATHPIAITAPMRPAVSDANFGNGGVSVNSFGLMLYSTAGTFESRVRDAGAGTVAWGALTAVASTPAGSAVGFSTRTGPTPTPDATWSNYQQVVGGAIQSPSARYIQYAANLTTPDDSVTPSLDKVQIDYDNTPPTTGNGGSGSTTTSGGTTTTTTSGGGNSGAVVDKTKPKVSAVAKSLRVSKTGTVSFRVGCPATEQSCQVTLQLKNAAGKTVASKTATIKGGKTATVTLKLTKAAKQQLAKRGSLKVSSVVSATDAAGNHRTTAKTLTLRRAAG